MLESDQVPVARAWLNVLYREVAALEEHGGAKFASVQVLALTKTRTIEWQEDKYWDQYMRVAANLPDEA